MAGFLGAAATGLSFGTGGSYLAKGGVYQSPSLSAYSGGVYNSPHMFKFAHGAGIFGEAGPEAIMPLTRTGDGKLGVKAQGSAAPVELQVILRNESGQLIQAKQTGQRIDGNKMAVEFVLQTVAADTAKGGITAKASAQRFGLQRRGVPVG